LHDKAINGYREKVGKSNQMAEAHFSFIREREVRYDSLKTETNTIVVFWDSSMGIPYEE
jgi:hypothetical protein